MTSAGGAAFWITDFVIAVSPIAPTYQAAFSITSMQVALVEAFAGGIFIAFCVSYLLLRFFERLPGKNTTAKALILVFGAMVIIEILSAVGDPAHASVNLLIDTGMNTPRFLALGLMIGYVFEMQNRKVQM